MDALRKQARLFRELDAKQIQESESPTDDFEDEDVNNDITQSILSRIVDPHSGKGSDEQCQALYECYQSGDPYLQAVVLRYIPSLCGVYFPRTCGDLDEPLAGFEAVLLALYTEEAKARGGRPLLIHLPSLSQPSLYHTPSPVSRASAGKLGVQQYAEQLNAPLEPQTAVKSTKRAAIVGLALDLFWRRIAIMPPEAKLECCQYARRWAVQGCSWGTKVDEIARLALLSVEPVAPAVEGEKVPELGHALASGESFAVSQAVFDQPPHHRTVDSGRAALIERTSSGGSLSFNSATSSVEHFGDEIGVKLPLSLDLLRPIFKVLGHCLMGSTSTPDVRAAAAGAARALYVRASEDIIPEAILASRSLVRLGAATEVHAVAPSGSLVSSRSSPMNVRNSEIEAES